MTKKRWLAVLLAFMLAYGTATVGSIAKEPQIQNKEATSKPKYLALIAQKAERAYFPLQGFETCKSSVSFQLDCKGIISNIEVQEHPYYWKTHATAPLADSALTYAVKNLHLPVPPKDLGCPVAIRLVFDGRGGGPTKILPEITEPSVSTEKSQKAVETSQHHTLP